jgi:hypothetical protein
VWGCIVTDRVDYQEEPDLAPSIESAAGADNPTNRFINFNLDTDVVPPATSLPDIPLEVVVRDGNVEQPLTLKVFVDNFTDAVREAPIPTNGSEQRDVTATVPGLFFNVQGCHRIEMRVSGGFDPASPREPLVDGDLGTQVWWVGTRTAGGSVDTTRCPEPPALGP